MDKNLTPLLDFVKLSAHLRDISRNNNATVDRKESVAEHCWHVALMCWLLQTELEKEFNIHISLDRMLKMSLMHDLVEIAVGDASVWQPADRQNKAQKEEAAALTIFANLPAPLHREFLDLWYEFEQAESLESKIVRGIDRLNPAIMRVITNEGWSDVQGDAQHLDSVQLPRVEFSNTLLSLYSSIKNEAIKKGLLKS